VVWSVLKSRCYYREIPSPKRPLPLAASIVLIVCIQGFFCLSLHFVYLSGGHLISERAYQTWHSNFLFPFSLYSPRSHSGSNNIVIIFQKCLLICWTPLQSRRHAPTSLSVSYRVQTVFSWISSVPDASKLPLSFLMHRQLSFVDPAMLCFASQLVDGLGWPRDALIERRLIKHHCCMHKNQSGIK